MYAHIYLTQIYLKNQRKTRMMKRVRTAIWWKVTGPSSSFFFCSTPRIASLSPKSKAFLQRECNVRFCCISFPSHLKRSNGRIYLTLFDIFWLPGQLFELDQNLMHSIVDKLDIHLLTWNLQTFVAQSPFAWQPKEVDLEPEPADEKIDEDSGQGKCHPADEEAKNTPKKITLQSWVVCSTQTGSPPSPLALG